MNKRNLFLTFIVVAVSFIAFKFLLARDSPSSQKPQENKSINTNALRENTTTVKLKNSEYTMSWVEISDLNKLEIISNIEKSLTSKEAKTTYNCQTITSAGFYSEDDTHLGLLIVDKKAISKAKESKLLNGYFYFDNKPSISSTAPQDTKYALQSGPLLILDGEIVRSLATNNEKARRIIIATTKRGTVLLTAIYKDDSQFKGPKLPEVPDVLKNFEKHLDTKITHALNLDGGSASLFVNDTLSLREISKAGGFFCLRY